MAMDSALAVCGLSLVGGSPACKRVNKFFFLKPIGGVNKGCPTEYDLRHTGEFLQRLQ